MCSLPSTRRCKHQLRPWRLRRRTKTLIYASLQRWFTRMKTTREKRAEEETQRRERSQPVVSGEPAARRASLWHSEVSSVQRRGSEGLYLTLQGTFISDMRLHQLNAMSIQSITHFARQLIPMHVPCENSRDAVRHKTTKPLYKSCITIFKKYRILTMVFSKLLILVKITNYFPT